MRNEKHLNVPNVHEHTIDARRRTNGTGKLHRVFDEPQPVKTQWWRQYFHWETLTVAGKTIEKGWVLPQSLGIALIVIILGGIGTLYWRMTDRIADQSRAMQEQRELLIRLDQRLIDKNEHDNQRFQKIESGFGTVEAWQQVTNKEIATLKAQRGKQ